MLHGSNFLFATLIDANLGQAELRHTIFAQNDLSQTKGLDEAYHCRESEISTSTILMSHGNISEGFLRECGVPELIINDLPLIKSMPLMQLYSCFISDSTKDEEFARLLHFKLRGNGRAWCSRENIQGGKKLYDQIDEQIPKHDKLLLVLSHDSMNSDWVKTEIPHWRSNRNGNKMSASFSRFGLLTLRESEIGSVLTLIVAKTWQSKFASTTFRISRIGGTNPRFVPRSAVCLTTSRRIHLPAKPG